MSRKGNCWDNSVMENFFGLLKTEMFYGNTFASIHELATEVRAYIDWYNTERIQERFEGMSPIEYRAHTLKLVG
ncbi:transposase [Alloscardovia venturai]|uniref:Transposase n=1 Tax=Alloscardovia venturai TaxID=1769421 RepID=A0ABW2Y511_9BIFI